MALATDNANGTELDSIRISGITATGFHGVLESERETGQEFSVDLTIVAALGGAAQDDDLNQTINYAHLAEAVVTVIAGPPVNLIETVAERIAAIVLENELVQAVTVTVHKPQAPIPVPFGGVAVTVNRSRTNMPRVSRPFTENGAAAVAALPAWADVDDAAPAHIVEDAPEVSEPQASEVLNEENPDEAAAIEDTHTEEVSADDTHDEELTAVELPGEEVLTEGAPGVGVPDGGALGQDTLTGEPVDEDAAVYSAAIEVPDTEVVSTDSAPAEEDLSAETPVNEVADLEASDNETTVENTELENVTELAAEVEAEAEVEESGDASQIADASTASDDLASTEDLAPAETEADLVASEDVEERLVEDETTAEDETTVEGETTAEDTDVASELGDSEDAVSAVLGTEPAQAVAAFVVPIMDTVPSATSAEPIEEPSDVSEVPVLLDAPAEPALPAESIEAALPAEPTEAALPAEPIVPTESAAPVVAASPIEALLAQEQGADGGAEVVPQSEVSSQGGSVSEDEVWKPIEMFEDGPWVDPVASADRAADQAQNKAQVQAASAADAAEEPATFQGVTDASDYPWVNAQANTTPVGPTLSEILGGNEYEPLDLSKPLFAPESVAELAPLPKPFFESAPVMVTPSAGSASSAQSRNTQTSPAGPHNTRQPAPHPTAEASVATPQSPAVASEAAATTSAQQRLEERFAVMMAEQFGEEVAAPGAATPQSTSPHSAPSQPESSPLATSSAHSPASTRSASSAEDAQWSPPVASPAEPQPVASAIPLIEPVTQRGGNMAAQGPLGDNTEVLPVTGVEEPHGDLARGGTAIIEPERPHRAPAFAQPLNSSSPAFTTLDQMDEEPSAPVKVVLALGANLGDAQGTLNSAVNALRATDGFTIVKVGPLALTAAVGGPDQNDYYNTVIIGETTMTPRGLLHATQAIENAHHRTRDVRWGPRTLDIDIITYGTLVATSEDLEIPHPRANARAFVLVPWEEADPTAELPGLGGGPVSALAATAPDRSGVRWLALNWLS